VVPCHKTMDHILPAIRHIEPCLTILVPLHEAVNDNVRKFSEQVLEVKIADEELDSEVISLGHDAAPYGTKQTWEQVWRSWLLSMHLIEKVPEQPQIRVLLNPELPLGVILSTATTSLSLPSLEMYEFPGGYNVRRNTEDYNPGSPLSEQAIKYSTWSQEGIATSFLYAAKGLKLAMVLQAAREIAMAGTEKDSFLLEEQDIGREDIKELLAKRGFTPSTTALSNLLKRARGIDLNTREKVHRPLILSTGKQSTYRLTSMGVIVTSLLASQERSAVVS